MGMYPIWDAGREAGMENVLSVADVAARYDVTPRTVRRWCRQGRLPGAVRVGARVWAIPSEALKDFEPPRPGPEPQPKD